MDPNGKDKRGAVSKTTRRQPVLVGATLRTPPSNRPVQTQRNSSQKTSQAKGDQSTNKDDSIYHCEVCLVTDNVARVCCDECNLWSHFQCAKVTCDVVNQDHWYCQKCQQKKQEPLINIGDDDVVRALSSQPTPIKIQRIQV